uniref:5-azacytidine-induced protein 2 n=1 Tax=Otolemur garnettii TaxID=30611 RepID=H0XIS9_OTOGA
VDTVVEDGIYILNHENGKRRDTVTPILIYSGDETRHFALVLEYEDIEKPLKDSEKENSLLKKSIRFLEEKLSGARLDEETSSVGHAYGEVCIDGNNLKSKLDKMNKDNAESLKVLNEQLQSKEVELQLRTEVETQQVMRNLNPPSSNWEVEKLSCDLKIHGLEQELELIRKRKECSDLKIELQKAKQTDPYQEDNLKSRDLQRLSISSDNMQHVYWELKREMSNLHLVTQVQLRRLKTPTSIKKPCAPGGCIEDLGKDSTSTRLHFTKFTATYTRHPHLSPNGKAVCRTTASPLPGDVKISSEKAILQSWTDDERSIPNDGTYSQEHNSYGRNSLEDNSWVFPNPPKSISFGEAKSKALPSPNLPPLHYLDQHNQNCLYKS